jgi:RNA polymerase sigma-70 factor (ECF subfamily)
MVQETLLAAWCGLDRFEGRASLRAWLYRIATNRCLNALRAKGRRRELTVPPAMPEPTRLAEPTWLEPYPDVLLEGVPDDTPGPEARYETRESVELAFIAGLQQLPPTQRAVVVLRDVLGFPGAATADMLDTSETSVKGALQRARATLRTRLHADHREHPPQRSSPTERQVVERFAHAVESGDVDSMIAMLTDDAWLTMSPQPHQYPRARGDRLLPQPPRQAPRRPTTRRRNPRQHATLVRLLPPAAAHADRASVRAARPHPPWRPDIGHHLVLRHECLPASRAPENPVGVKPSWCSRGQDSSDVAAIEEFHRRQDPAPA